MIQDRVDAIRLRVEEALRNVIMCVEDCQKHTGGYFPVGTSGYANDPAVSDWEEAGVAANIAKRDLQRVLALITGTDPICPVCKGLGRLKYPEAGNPLCSNCRTRIGDRIPVEEWEQQPEKE